MMASSFQRLFCTLIVCFAAPWASQAQDPKLAQDDLDYTKKVIEKAHLICHVSMRFKEDKYTRYTVDHYAGDVDRIREEEGTFARLKGKRWLRSEDWGKTGKPVTKETAAQLDEDLHVALSFLEKPETHDASQGGFVWKFIDRSAEADLEYFTYERTREHPRPTGVYPRYTFIRYKKDKDGELLLNRTKSQFVDGEHVIPVEIKFDYMFPVNIQEVEPAKSKAPGVQ